MKIILILFLFSAVNVFPQWKSEYSPKVEEYINILDGYLQNLNYLPQPDEFNLTDEELDYVLKKMYEAIEDDPIGYTNFFAKEYRERERDIKEKKLDKNIPGIGNIQGVIQRKIANKYSRKFLTLLTTPYFLRVKITDKSPGVYTTKDGITNDSFIIKSKVEEILKGGKRFDEGNNISFMYSSKPTLCIRNYEVGKSYFVPFTVTTLENSNYEGLLPQWFDCKGNYLIENETITIPENYFDISDEVSWDEFKVEFINKYIIH